MYEVLVAWETMDDPDPRMRDFAQIWRAAEKIVYSTHAAAGLQRPHANRATRSIPSRSARFKDGAERDLTIGGPQLAALAFEAGLVDEMHLFLSPVIVGGGKRALPDGVRLEFGLVDERRFANGVVHLHHRARRL